MREDEHDIDSEVRKLGKYSDCEVVQCVYHFETRYLSKWHGSQKDDWLRMFSGEFFSPLDVKRGNVLDGVLRNNAVARDTVENGRRISTCFAVYKFNLIY